MDAIRECLEIGQSQGIAKQKAEDEKVVAQQAERIKQLEAMLAQK